MRVAARMGSIGTESAFEVSARARALEAQGDLEAIAELAIRHDLWVLTDEIYATSQANLTEALRRIRTFVEGLGRG